MDIKNATQSQLAHEFSAIKKSLKLGFSSQTKYPMAYCFYEGQAHIFDTKEIFSSLDLDQFRRSEYKYYMVETIKKLAALEIIILKHNLHLPLLTPSTIKALKADYHIWLSNNDVERLATAPLENLPLISQEILLKYIPDCTIRKTLTVEVDGVMHEKIVTQNALRLLALYMNKDFEEPTVLRTLIKMEFKVPSQSRSYVIDCYQTAFLLRLIHFVPKSKH